jgi:hypothetical protein
MAGGHAMWIRQLPSGSQRRTEGAGTRDAERLDRVLPVWSRQSNRAGYRLSREHGEWNAYFLSDLAKHHEVVVFDNCEIGQSQMLGASYSVRELAGDTAALIRG